MAMYKLYRLRWRTDVDHTVQQMARLAFPQYYATRQRRARTHYATLASMLALTSLLNREL